MSISDKITVKVNPQIVTNFSRSKYASVSEFLGLPGVTLKFFAPSDAGDIGLSVTDYVKLGSTLQPVFFSDSTTPILRTYSEWSAILTALPSINTENAIGITSIGWWIGNENTMRWYLNRVLRWFELTEIEPILSDLYFGTEHYTDLENYVGPEA